MNRTHQWYSCCANISNLRQHLCTCWQKSAKEPKSNSSSTKWTKIEARIPSFIIEYGSSLKIQEPDYVPVAFCTVQQCGFFHETEFRVNWLDIILFGNHFSGFPLYFPRYTDPNVPQPNLFSFLKSFHSNFGNSGLPFFLDLLGW
jgi:hypothetical protein